MKNVLALLSLLLLSVCSMAQAPEGRISGRIVDSIGLSPIEYATITLYQPGKTRPLNGATANSKGVFTLDGLAPGAYTLTVGFIGYRTYLSGTLTISGKTPLALGDIFLTKRRKLSNRLP